MNCKTLGRKWPWHTIPAFAWRDLGKPKQPVSRPRSEPSTSRIQVLSANSHCTNRSTVMNHPITFTASTLLGNSTWSDAYTSPYTFTVWLLRVSASQHAPHPAESSQCNYVAEVGRLIALCSLSCYVSTGRFGAVHSQKAATTSAPAVCAYVRNHFACLALWQL